MNRPKCIAPIENVYFLARMGKLLRMATQDVAREDLPPAIKQLLARLDRMELRTARAFNDNEDG
jgi:hypothetical protein